MPTARGWTAESHEALLFAFIQECFPDGQKKAILTKITERMNAMGFIYSYDAVNQHVQKLRKNRNVSAIGGTPAGTPKTTPSNAGTKIPGSRKRAASAKNILKAENGSEMDDEDIFKIKREKKESDEDGTPSMPAAKRVKKLADPVAESYLGTEC